jgi:bis(5'-nucleosyl)-tetraphosphatase (symmetrical)
MRYLVGDLQGCCGAFDRLLQQIDFSPSRDHLVVLGDLVNRGPQSLAVLQRLRGLGEAATCLLGNHDLHLLAVAHGVRRPHRSDTLGDILQAPDRDAWLDWLRQRRWPVWTAAGCACTPAWCRNGPPRARWTWPPRSKRCWPGPTWAAFCR